MRTIPSCTGLDMAGCLSGGGSTYPRCKIYAQTCLVPSWPCNLVTICRLPRAKTFFCCETFTSSDNRTRIPRGAPVIRCHRSIPALLEIDFWLLGIHIVRKRRREKIRDRNTPRPGPWQESTRLMSSFLPIRRHTEITASIARRYQPFPDLSQISPGRAFTAQFPVDD